MRKISTIQEKLRAKQILAQEFQDSEGMNWMLKHRSVEKLEELIDFMLQEALSREGAYITSDNNGIVFFHNTEKKFNSFSLSNLVRIVKLFAFTTGIKKGVQLIRYQKTIQSNRIKGGLIATLLAVDSKNKLSTKTAYEIKTNVFKTSDQFKLPLYIETTKKRAMLLYRALGFVLYKTLEHPFIDGSKIWLYHRNPNLS